MNRFAADDGRQRAICSPDCHPLADELLGVPAADRLGVQKAVVVVMADEHPDLVAVTREHYPQLGVWIFGGDDVAVQICRHPVGEIADVGANHVLNRSLITGGTGRFEEFDEKLTSCRFHGRRRPSGVRYSDPGLVLPVLVMPQRAVALPLTALKAQRSVYADERPFLAHEPQYQ